jgi:hypothetical protein
MKKLRLDFEQLAVESFDVTSDAVRGSGTVRGQASGHDTCVATCGPCGDSEFDTCTSCEYGSCPPKCTLGGLPAC